MRIKISNLLYAIVRQSDYIKSKHWINVYHYLCIYMYISNSMHFIWVSCSRNILSLYQMYHHTCRKITHEDSNKVALFTFHLDVELETFVEMVHGTFYTITYITLQINI